jgi:hypothetical protein
MGFSAVSQTCDSLADEKDNDIHRLAIVAESLALIQGSQLLCSYEFVQENFDKLYRIGVVKTRKPDEDIQSAAKALDAAWELAARILPEKFPDYVLHPEETLCPLFLNGFGPSGTVMKDVIRNK